MNGTIGPRGEASIAFSAMNRRNVYSPVVLWDERLTTMAAERVLFEADVSRKKRKKVIDKMAAVMILQGYLDSQTLTEMCMNFYIGGYFMEDANQITIIDENGNEATM